MEVQQTVIQSNTQGTGRHVQPTPSGEIVRPQAVFTPAELLSVISASRTAAFIVKDQAAGRVGLATALPQPNSGHQLIGTLPPLYPEWLGDRSFCEAHSIRFPYVSGAMANGIATTQLVIAMAKSGMLGFFGAAGLAPQRVEAALDELQSTLDPLGLPWGSNLIHSPAEPGLEESVVNLYISRGVKRVSASAYMSLTPHIVRYAVKGLTQSSTGEILRAHHVFAKISRPEVARHFMCPAPKAMLDALLAQGKISAQEAALAANLPIAENIIVESDSGGHTDNKTLNALFPVILQLRDELAHKYQYTRPIHCGAAGGLGSPSAVAAAFSLGAAFVLTGSVNQGAVESGLSEEGRKLLSMASTSDVMMAPAADMFELGVEVQVLKRGTMFGVRGHKLYEIYKKYDSLDAIAPDERARLEKEILSKSLDAIWSETVSFWNVRGPQEIERANRDPKHKMALCFRWYLGQASRWAIHGDSSRRMDYQIWCGQAMGAFNAWVKGTFLEAPENRGAVQIALNLLEGAAAITRAQQFRTYGVPVPSAAFSFIPRKLS
jgi:trans-AT polyketide synthase/acyltransferase/oxidoreductase domain-containing protein